MTIECAIFRRKVLTAASALSPGVFLSLTLVTVSAVPWVLAIVIALPLAIAGGDLNNCRFHPSLTRAQANVWVCQVLPFITAVVITCLQQQQPPPNYFHAQQFQYNGPPFGGLSQNGLQVHQNTNNFLLFTACPLIFNLASLQVKWYIPRQALTR